MIRYIMKRQLVLQQYLTEGNKSILQAGNFNAILKKLCSDLEKHEKEYLDVLQDNLIPIKSRKVMTSETWARYFVLAMEIKQLTLALLNYIFDTSDYFDLNQYAHDIFRSVCHRKSHLVSLSNIVKYIWQQSSYNHSEFTVDLAAISYSEQVE